MGARNAMITLHAQFEFPLNYTKLATLPTKDHARKSAKYSAKNCLKWRLNPGPLDLHTNALLTELSQHVAVGLILKVL